MFVGDEIAGAVGRLPIAPEREPQTIPPHAREVRHVFVDHPLAIGVQIPGSAVIRGCG